MKNLILGDIHGNILALEKVIKLEKNSYDLLVCHGDVVNYGPWSDECVDLLESIPCIKLMGNHENYFIQKKYSDTNNLASTFFDFCSERFNRANEILNYSEYFESEMVLIQHTINNRYFFPDTEIFTLNLSKDTVIGHSHYQFILENNEGFRLINTGSIGQNRQFINIVNYIKYNTLTKEVELCSIKYDVEVLINEMIIRKYPEICINYYQNKNKL